jgi:uncharacterized membrane protein (DUF373 family)
MRIWRFWWNTLIVSSQHNPPQFVEILMLWLALVLLGIWSITPYWPYLVLSLSYVVGASISLLVREAIAPTNQARVSQVTAVLMLIISIYGFTDLIRYL